jgi:hypothetical protein
VSGCGEVASDAVTGIESLDGIEHSRKQSRREFKAGTGDGER